MRPQSNASAAGLLSLFALCASILRTGALKNGRGLTPTMGWSSILAFQCHVDYHRITEQVDHLKSTGLAASFYRTVLVDCGWQGTKRDGNSFQVDKKRFRDGMKKLGDYTSQNQLDLGLMTSAGLFGCGTGEKLSSGKYESNDIATFSGWGVDFLQVRLCWPRKDISIDFNVNPNYARSIFQPFTNAVLSLATPMTLAVDTKGGGDPVSWPVENMANIYRIAPDLVGDGKPWDNVVRAINLFASHAPRVKPGIFADLDLLLVGTDHLNPIEAKTQFSFWAAAKSPMMLSTDLNKIKAEDLDLLKHGEILGVNQDALGQSIQLVRRRPDMDIWKGKLSGDNIVVVIVNYGQATSATFNLADVGVESARVRDIWLGIDLGDFSNAPITRAIEAHGVLIFKLSRVNLRNEVRYVSYNITDPEYCHLLGPYKTRKLTNGATVAGNMGGQAYMEWHGVNAGEGGDVVVTFDYVLGYDGPSTDPQLLGTRLVSIVVNGNPEVTVAFPASGGSWDTIYKGFPVKLGPFLKGDDNQVIVRNLAGLLPDFVSLNMPEYHPF